MYLAPSSLNQYREAFKHMRAGRALSPKGGSVSRFFELTREAYLASWKCSFGLTSFDVLIAGPDILLNLILAYRAAEDGRRVAIYHGEAADWQNMEELERIRYPQFHSALSELIEKQLGIKQVGSSFASCIQELGFNIDLAAGGDAFNLGACKLIGNKESSSQYPNHFLVEPRAINRFYPSVEQMVFWPQTYSDRFNDLQKDSPPRHAIQAKELWLTALPVTDDFFFGFSRENKSSLRLFGEAAYPLDTMTGFSGVERLRDINHALQESLLAIF